MPQPPTRFAKALLAALDAQGFSMRQLAKALSVAPSTVTRFIRSEREVDGSFVATVCRHFSGNPALAYDLLIAHLFDVAEVSGLDLSRLTIRYSGEVEFDFDSLSPGIQGILQVLVPEATRTPELAATLHDLAELVLRSHARAADAASGQVYRFSPASADLAVGEAAPGAPPPARPAQPAPSPAPPARRSRPAPPVPHPGGVA